MEHSYEKKRFFIAEFTEEAEWLSKKHREGYRFVSTTGSRYEFEPCEKEDWVYELDFKENGVAEEDYLQMYIDYGWEYVFQYGKWFYFRKKKEAGQQENLSIFSDNESKIAMCQRVLRGQFVYALPLFIIMFVYEYLIFFNHMFDKHDFISGVGTGIGIGMMLIALLGLGIYFGQFMHIQKKMKDLENPIK